MARDRKPSLTRCACGRSARSALHNSALAITFALSLATGASAVESCPSGPDADSDGVCDARDNCRILANPTQLDADLDGYGNLCDADYNGDRIVSTADVGSLLESFGAGDPAPEYDIRVDTDGSGSVTETDIQRFLDQFGLQPGPSGLACAGSIPCAATLESPSQTEHVLARTTYGATPALRARITTLGVEGFIDEQLAPESMNDAALEARLAGFATRNLSVSELVNQYEQPPLNRVPLDELTDSRILRILSGERQLEEQLVDFWLNHFSVYAATGGVRLTIVAYERDSIRPFVLGRFAELLAATARAPAMLEYLDNRFNFSNRLNENYARELLELHTLGVDAGYTQADVIEVARILTGWGIDDTVPDGFRFRANRHDDDAKRVLDALDVPANSGEGGGDALFEFLAARPETATFVCEKLVRRFVDEDAPPRLVAAAAAEFLASDGDLKAVMQTLLRSPEFLDEPERRRTKVKRPAVLMASLARTLDADIDTVAPSTESQISALDEAPYRARPPTGYPEDSAFWASPGSLVTALNHTERAARGLDGYSPSYDVAETENVFVVVDGLIAQLLPDGASGATRNGALALGHVLRTRPADRRIQQIAAYLLSSPEFLLH